MGSQFKRPLQNMDAQFKDPVRGSSASSSQSFQGMNQPRGNTWKGAGQQGTQMSQGMGQRSAPTFQGRGQQSANSLQGMGRVKTARDFGAQPSPAFQGMGQQSANSLRGLEIQRGNTARGTGRRRNLAAPDPRQRKTQKTRKHRRIHMLVSAVLCVLLLLVCGGYWYMQANAATRLTSSAGGSHTSTIVQTPGQPRASDANAQIATSVPTATPTATTPPWHPYTGPDVPLMSISAQDGLIVISISKQNLTVYNKGQVVFVSLVTTGMPTAYTPTGTFHIIGKVTNRYFGPPAGSNLHYAPEHINYAVQLTTGGIFIHDSAWRSVYGPGTNLPHNDPEFGEESGSHGCINTPLNIAYWLYKSIAMGTTVQVVS